MEKLYAEAVENAGSHLAVLSSPADIFAVCAKIAKVSGCYLLYSEVDKAGLTKAAQCELDGAAWVDAIEKYSGRLRTPAAALVGALPKQIVSSWKAVASWLAGSASTSLAARGSVIPARVASSVLYLIAVADEACGGLGLPDGGSKRFFSLVGNLRLARSGTLCRFIRSPTIRVLPKQHTPRFGLNLRNLTHHLAFCENPEVGVRWNINPVLERETVSFNVLLVPWPFEVRSSDIRAANQVSSSERVGYFDYVPGLKTSPVKEVVALVELTESRGQRVDLVVMPECAVSEAQWRSLSAALLKKKISLLSGVSGKSERSERATNSVRLKVPGNPGDLLTQHKHHRWKLEKNQIRNYGLGGTLSCTTEWWENIDLQPREVNFFAFTKNLVVCPLICEDLARQDPVADVVRSVGPNLVIALLMDGPQLANRWPARYASVLADDPGSSVLTLSSLGMVKISRPPRGADLRRAIASWKEPQGDYTEICLPPDARSALLNIQFLRESEQTVDGRGDAGVASSPVLAGIHYV